MGKNKALLAGDDNVQAHFLTRILEMPGMKTIDHVCTDRKADSPAGDHWPDPVVIKTRPGPDSDWLRIAHELQKVKGSPIFILSDHPDQFMDGSKNSPDPMAPKRNLSDNGNGAVTLKSNGRLTKSAADRPDTETEDLFNVENGHYSFFKDVIFVKNEFVYQKINIPDLKWVEASRSYCKIVTSDKSFLLSINLNSFHKMVKYPSIIRVHRSFVVNIDKIDAFEGNSIFIDQKSIPIGNTYKKDFVRVFPFIEKSGIVVK